MIVNHCDIPMGEVRILNQWTMSPRFLPRRLNHGSRGKLLVLPQPDAQLDGSLLTLQVVPKGQPYLPQSFVGIHAIPLAC